MEIDLLKYVLPSILIDNFTLVKIEEGFDITKNRKSLTIYLDEANKLPAGYNSDEYESKGFIGYTTIQDFPLRDKLLYLKIRKRRWRHKINKHETIQNDYSQLTDGTQITKELTDFLKDGGRYAHRTNK
jgi:hypothetical protein